MSGIFFRMLMTFLQRGCQNCIIRVQANNLKKSFAFLKRCILYRSRTLTKKLPPFFEFFSAQLSKPYSTCLEDYFERINTYLEAEFISRFSDIERIFFSLLPEFFGLSCQNCILSVQRKIKGKTVFRKKCTFSAIVEIETKFSAFLSELFWLRYQICAQGVKANSLKNMFSGKLVICRSGTMKKKFSPFYRNRKEIRWVVKATSYVFQRKFSEKIHLFGNCHIFMKKFRVSLVTCWDIEMKLFCLLVKNSLVDYQNCILRVRKNNLKQVFFIYMCFLTLLDCKWNFLAFIKFLSAEIVKTAFCVSIGTFWEKKFSRKIVFLINFKIEWKLFQNVDDISSAGLSKLHYTSPGEQFEEKFCFFEKMHFVSFSDIDKKITAVFWIFFGAVVKTVFYLSRRLFWKNKYISWSRIYLIIFRYWANIFQPFVVIFWTVLSKLHSKCPKKI